MAGQHPARSEVGDSRLRLTYHTPANWLTAQIQ